MLKDSLSFSQCVVQSCEYHTVAFVEEFTIPKEKWQSEDLITLCGGILWGLVVKGSICTSGKANDV